MADVPALAFLPLCRTTKDLRQIHARAIVAGLYRFAFVASKILAFSALSPQGDIRYAMDVLNSMSRPNVYDYNSIIWGFSRTSEPEMGVVIFCKMRTARCTPNHRTFPGMLKCCVRLDLIDQTHCLVTKLGLVFDAHISSCLVTMYSRFQCAELAASAFDSCECKNVVSWTSLVSSYARSGMVEEARNLFDAMPHKNEVSWSAMVSGYVQNGKFEEAIELFRKMKESRCVRFNKSLLVSVVNACAEVGALKEGRWIHQYLHSIGFDGEIEMESALIDFYAKCGCIADAISIFQIMEFKDVVAWSTMIFGLAKNGEDDMALLCFDEMEKAAIQPNSVTLLAVLTACSHKMLVSEAWRLFARMSKVYCIAPEIDHYGCMVDLLARSGRVEDADRLIDLMPMEPDGALLSCILNGCLVHEHFQLGMKYGRLLTQLEPKHRGWHVLLSNMYAKCGNWEEVFNLRGTMRRKGVEDGQGWSFVEVDGTPFKFCANDATKEVSAVFYQLKVESNCYSLDSDCL